MYSTADKRVYISPCGNYGSEALSAALEKTFRAFGVLEKAAGKTVALKANLLYAAPPERAVTTHPAVVCECVRLLYAAGAKKVIIGDSPSGAFTEKALSQVYELSGMSAAAALGAELNFDTSAITRPNSGASAMREFTLTAWLARADMIISLSKLKTHRLTRMTAAVKNLYGAVAGFSKRTYHAKLPDKYRFSSMLVDLCDTVAPDFSVIDGIMGMEGEGPGAGEPKFAGVLVAGVNPHACDLAAAEIIGAPHENVPTLAEARKRGYIPGDAQKLEILGAPLSSVKTKFLPPRAPASNILVQKLPPFLGKPLSWLTDPYPVITQKCVGCGRCAQACPRERITITAGKARINYKGCIKCYCCQEICRFHAIEMKKSLFAPR